MPEIQKVHGKFAGQKVRIIGVNQGEELSDVQAMLEEKNFTFSHLLDSDSSVGELFGVSGIPQTVVIDADGVIQSVHVGYSPTLAATLTGQIEKLLRGEQLYDPEKVAEARKRREERLAKAAEELGLKNKERLKRLGELLTDSDANLSDTYNTAAWITLPAESQPSLAVVIGERRLAIVRPGAAHAETVDVQLPEGFSIWSCTPVVLEQEVQFAVVAAKYDDDYDLEKLAVLLCNGQGKPRWTHKLPVFEGDYTPDLFTAAANLTGDDAPEIVVVVDHGGLSEMQLTGPGDSTRVLTVFDLDGEQLVRTFVPGYGGVAMYVLPEQEGNTLLLTTSEGLTRFRIGQREK